MDMVYGVFVAFILSCVVMYVFMQFVGTYVFPVALRLQKKYILPLVMVMSLIDVVAGFTVSITSASRDVQMHDRM